MSFISLSLDLSLYMTALVVNDCLVGCYKIMKIKTRNYLDNILLSLFKVTKKMNYDQ